MKKALLSVFCVLMLTLMLTGCGRGGGQAVGVAGGPQQELVFYIVPKVVHEWFDAVHAGALYQANLLSQLGLNVRIRFVAPINPDVVEQNRILEAAAATRPHGIALDPLDFEGSRAIVEEIQARGIPVIIFDARVPGMPSVGNNFTEQSILQVDDLATRLGGTGTVAIMHGVPTASNHSERFNAKHTRFAERWPGIRVIDGGISQDSIEIAQMQAAAVIAANPDLDGFLCVDAAAPIGIARAIIESGRQDRITFVGAENLLQILYYVQDGTIVTSYSTKPQMQGALSVLMMLQAHIGGDLPQFVDTGILHIHQGNINQWIEIVREGARETAALN